MWIRKLTSATVVVFIGVLPSEAHAGDSIGGSSTSTAGITGNQIMAGIQYGATAGSSGASEDCEWSIAIPHDAHSGNGTAVQKVLGGTTYRLFEYTCLNRTPATTFHWIPQVSTAQLAQQATSVVYDNIPAPWGNFAPPAQRGVVKLGTWFWVNPLMWVPVSATAGVPTPAGYISVTTTATPKKLIFDPGDGALGSGPVSCDGPGLPWIEMFGDTMSSKCMYTYAHSSSMHPSGAFPAKLSVQWHITYTTSLGVRGTVGDFTFAASHQIVVREVQALVTN